MSPLTASRRRGVLAALCVAAAGIVLLAGLQWAAGDGEVPSEAAGSGDVRLAGPVAPGRDPLTAPGSVLVGVGPAAPRAQSASERSSSPPTSPRASSSPRSSAPTPSAPPGSSSASPDAPTSATSPAAQVARNPFRAPGQAATTQATQTPSPGAPAADPPAAGTPATGTPPAAAAPPGGRNPFQALVTPPAAPSGGQQPGGQQPSDRQPASQPSDGPQSGEPGAPTGSPTTSGPPTDRDGVLGRGNSGPQVRDLQQVLVDRGWTLRVDGIFGPRTEGVVRELQRRRGLVPDGLVGPKTRAVLSSR